MGEHVPGTGEQSATKVRPEATEPKMYRVLMHNDHYTTMDFVVAVLKTVFRKPSDEAVRIMLNIHREGVGMCGVFPLQVAETKIAAVHAHAQKSGYPLRCSAEPE